MARDFDNNRDNETERHDWTLFIVLTVMLCGSGGLFFLVYLLMRQ